jgi:hypothetical protein
MKPPCPTTPSSASVVYPHYWWLKNVTHPEFQAKDPPEYDLATVELWLIYSICSLVA